MQVKNLQNEFFKYFWLALEKDNREKHKPPDSRIFNHLKKRKGNRTPLRQEWHAPKLETLLHLWPFFCINIAFP